MDMIQFCKVHHIEWAFFDCFDTLLHRTILEDELRYKWAQIISEECSLGSSEVLIDIRQNVLEEFHQKENFNYNYIDVMEAVYTRLLYMQNSSFTVEKQKFLSMTIMQEIALERGGTVIDDSNVELLHRLAESGIKIAIISDFYIGEDGLREILSGKNILPYIERIFVSCDYKKRKSDGDLYRAVLEELNIGGEKCIMLGDNKKSDVKKAQIYKINAFFRPYYPELRSPESVLNQIYKNNVEDATPGLQYAYSIYLFFYRLYVRLREINQTNVFFLAREGEFLKEAFDAFLHINNVKDIRTYYLYVSRKSTLMPSLKSLEEETFKNVFRHTGTLSLQGFLDVLGFSELDKEKIYQSLKVGDPKDVYRNFAQSDVFFLLCRNPVFLDIYENNRQAMRQSFISYVQSFNVDLCHNEFILVDVGWKGTIQDNIYHIYNGTVKVHGFYIGLTGLGDFLPNNLKEGLLFSVAPIKSKDYGIWLNREFYERFMRASHGMTICYKIRAGVGEPVLEDVNSEIDAYYYARPTQRKLISVIEQITQTFLPYTGAERYIEKLLRSLHKKAVLCTNSKELIFERNLFALNKESFLNVWEKTSTLETLVMMMKRVKYIAKNLFNIEFYNKSFMVYSLPPCFVMLWGRCIYMKQKLRGEL
ncbi:hypothetical protein AXF19_00865 [Selenomonas sp. oral taxon 126]|uniref:HAD family hydrolase n=1 Tax=Selenomonas sp. oral taxon 126 TaxID=712528 RepID=UPI0008078E63|nr:HAD family hydrolase [Selenomonas sp. oral taxon 126]ANR69689.1 hypothetical protein AXF19_00865 [Selenomonas sp. oral taxon 126]